MSVFHDPCYRIAATNNPNGAVSGLVSKMLQVSKLFVARMMDELSEFIVGFVSRMERS